MPKVSVVMPALNVSKYIRECMESVTNQTLKDLEILVIDAGSTDGTLEILQEYEKQDVRVRVIYSPQKSYGYQVNMGISLAKGDYVGILETDDIIVPDMYETLYAICVDKDVDFAKGYTKPFYTIYGDEKFFSTSNTFFIAEGISGQVINPSERPDTFLKDRFLWLGIYRREFIQNIKLNETSGAAFQDVGFMFQTLSQAKRAVYIDKPIHFYRQDNSGSSIHNRKSVSYIVNEYGLDRQYLNGKNLDWHSVFYTRMFDQINSRFDAMAIKGDYWYDAVPDIDNIREQLKEAVLAGYLSKKNMGNERWRKLQLFFADREGIYKEYLKKYMPIMTEFRDLLELIGENQVVIFGAGKYGVFLYKLLKRNSKNVVAFCDNNVKLHNTMIMDVPIFTIETAVTEFANAVFVIANANHYDEMKEQVLQYGIVREKIGKYSLGKCIILLISQF